VATPSSSRGDKTLADWLALPDDARIELIDGVFVEKAAPASDHARAQVETITGLNWRFGRRTGGPERPGGWLFASELDIVLDGRVFRPDITGFRRDRVPALPRERPCPIRPDWICEITSDTHRANDTVVKLRRYHQSAVPHYWILDQLDRTLTVHRHTADGYLVALRAAADERVRAEPFDAVELAVGVLLGDDPED
jgi:Uma2 family endonuclease